MKCLEIAKLQFKPENSDNEIKEIFECYESKVLWCCIKSNHVTDQFFNTRIIAVAKELQQHQPNEYDEFIKLCEPLVNLFGRITIQGTAFDMLQPTKTDHEYWSGIFNHINGKGFKTVYVGK